MVVVVLRRASVEITSAGDGSLDHEPVLRRVIALATCLSATVPPYDLLSADSATIAGCSWHGLGPGRTTLASLQVMESAARMLTVAVFAQIAAPQERPDIPTQLEPG